MNQTPSFAKVIIGGGLFVAVSYMSVPFMHDWIASRMENPEQRDARSHAHLREMKAKADALVKSWNTTPDFQPSPTWTQPKVASSSPAAAAAPAHASAFQRVLSETSS
jgi:hypothetical protein